MPTPHFPFLQRLPNGAPLPTEGVADALLAAVPLATELPAPPVAVLPGLVCVLEAPNRDHAQRIRHAGDLATCLADAQHVPCRWLVLPGDWMDAAAAPPDAGEAP